MMAAIILRGSWIFPATALAFITIGEIVWLSSSDAAFTISLNLGSSEFSTSLLATRRIRLALRAMLVAPATSIWGCWLDMATWHLSKSFLMASSEASSRDLVSMASSTNPKHSAHVNKGISSRRFIIQNSSGVTCHFFHVVNPLILHGFKVVKRSLVARVSQQDTSGWHHLKTQQQSLRWSIYHVWNTATFHPHPSTMGLCLELQKLTMNFAFFVTCERVKTKPNGKWRAANLIAQ